MHKLLGADSSVHQITTEPSTIAAELAVYFASLSKATSISEEQGAAL